MPGRSCVLSCDTGSRSKPKANGLGASPSVDLSVADLLRQLPVPEQAYVRRWPCRSLSSYSTRDRLNPRWTNNGPSKPNLHVHFIVVQVNRFLERRRHRASSC